MAINPRLRPSPSTKTYLPNRQAMAASPRRFFSPLERNFGARTSLTSVRVAKDKYSISVRLRESAIVPRTHHCAYLANKKI